MTTTRGRVRVEPTAKRVRTYLGGRLIADSVNVKMVWEKPYYPTYYIPASDVNIEFLVASGDTNRSPSRGDSEVYDVKTDKAEALGAALWYRQSPIDEIADHVRIDFGQMESWFEEDEQIYVHPRDPYTRVDVLQSSRHVEVFIGGEKVADSRQPKLLFETGLPTRYYLPKTDVRMDLLTVTDLETYCPYKGMANYYTVDAGGESFENVVWWYRHPIGEAADIAGYVSFYNERVEIHVDGVPEQPPETPFS
ncbi:MAG TPA: DUF427 domain-containing protein [Acidimicrobiia bacterium]|jgi:uncharacterized protein (DUF427 family)